MTTKSQFVKDMEKCQGTWKDSKTEYDTTYGGERVETGEYVARIANYEVKKSKSSDKWMVERKHTIIAGKYKGVTIRDYIGLESTNIQYVARVRNWLNVLGYEQPEEIADLWEIIEVISKEGQTVQIEVKDKGADELPNVIVKCTISIDDNDDDNHGGGINTTAKTETETEINDDENDDDKENETVMLLRAFFEANVSEDDLESCNVEKAISDLEYDEMLEILNEFEFPSEELEEDEIKLLKELDLENLIKYPEKKKTKVKKSKKK